MRNIDDYTNKYIAEGWYEFEEYQVKYRIKNILEVLKKYSHESVLEIGCGLEPIGKYMTDIEKYTIVEPSKLFIENASKMFHKKNDLCLVKGFFEEKFKIFKQDKFSVIILSGLLQEVEAPNLMMKAIEEVADDQTVIHINVANGNSFHRLLALESGIIQSVTEFSSNNINLQQHSVFTMDTLISCIKDSLHHDIEILDSGSYWIKPFTHKQMAMMMNENIINEKILDGFEKMIKYMPELGSEIFVNFRIKY